MDDHGFLPVRVTSGRALTTGHRQRLPENLLVSFAVAGQEMTLTDEERDQLSSAQLLQLNALGHALSAQDRARLTPAQRLQLDNLSEQAD